MVSISDWLNEFVRMNQLQTFEGVLETSIEGVRFYQSLTGHDWQPFVYQSGIIVLGQGTKQIHLGDKQMHYGANDYLVVGVPMPLKCKAVIADGKPIMGLSIEITSQRLASIIQKLDQSPEQTKKEEVSILSSIAMDQNMKDACTRLAKILCNPDDSRVLGQHILDEIVYRTLTTAQGQVLYELANQEGHFSRIANSLNTLHQSYAQAITVEQLAKEASMSVSAFHTAFRKVTMESPIQYIKKIRLNKARELIQVNGVKVNDAARQVGYNSASQFSREYKRLFNQSPKQNNKALQL